MWPDLCSELSDSFEFWHVSSQYCYQTACQIPKWFDYFNYRCPGFETSRDRTIWCFADTETGHIHIFAINQLGAKHAPIINNTLSSSLYILYDIFLRDPTSDFLGRAKRLVERYYKLVGVTEEMDKFIQLLELVLPDYFAGVHRIYEKNSK